jgi:integrase
VRERLIARSPVVEVDPIARKNKGTRIVPTQEQARAFVEQSPDPRTRVLVAIMAYTGARIGEALSTKWSGYNVEAATLEVVGKTGARVVPVGSTLARELASWRAVQLSERLASIYWADPDLIVSTEAGTPWDQHNARRRYRVVAAKVCPGATPHSLRHAVGTFLLEAGVDIRVVSDLLGHSSTTITQNVYQHVSPSMSRQAVDVLEGAIGIA